MRTRFAQVNNPQVRYWVTWTTLLQPISADQSEAALKLAQSLVQPKAPDHFRLTLAVTQLRCGQLAKAAKYLEQLHQDWEAAKEKPKTISPAYLWYFLAMA